MNASGRPTSRPSGNASGRPTAFPSGQPRPSGSGGFRGGGGGFFGTAAPDGVDQQTWEKAQKACESLRPTAFPNGGNGNGGGGGRDAAYRNCLTEHGVTVSGPVDQLDTADAKVAAAVTACAPSSPALALPRPDRPSGDAQGVRRSCRRGGGKRDAMGASRALRPQDRRTFTSKARVAEQYPSLA